MKSLFDHDPCDSKHGGNEQSEAAYVVGRSRHASSREQIVAMLHAAGERGLTREEIAVAMGRQTHAISGRVTELLGEQPPRVRESGATRKTASGASAAVLVHVSQIGGTLDRPSAIRERM